MKGLGNNKEVNKTESGGGEVGTRSLKFCVLSQFLFTLSKINLYN